MKNVKCSNTTKADLRDWCLLWGCPGVVILTISLLISLKVGDGFGRDNYVGLSTFLIATALQEMVYYLFLSVLADMPLKWRNKQQDEVLFLPYQEAEIISDATTDNADVEQPTEYQSEESVKAECLNEITEIADTAATNEEDMPEAGESPINNQHSAPSYTDLYKQGCDDYYKVLAAQKREQLDCISVYLHYIMAPFIKQEELEAFCSEIMSFAANPDYEPKPWRGLKNTLTSFDVRHLIWNVVSRLGLGKGKPYSVELCIRFIRTMFPDLCESLDPSTLKNLKVASANDKIRIDEAGKYGISFHIPKE
ncbi:MAG: hypothetical protein K2H92_01760 [Bacteroidaceae bacterium]|nr:hypothetical protein [Bacteroidaceae bacterium]